MKIIKKGNGTLLVEQYGKTYIRFAAGEIAEILYQVPITSEEKEKVISGEYLMAEVVNSYSNKGELNPEELMDNLIKDYLEYNTDFSNERKNKIIKKLRKYGDIFYEFYHYALKERIEEEGVVIEGYSAKRLNAEYPLSILGAYNYLIYLREDPKNALKDLRNGLWEKQYIIEGPTYEQNK